MAKHKVWVARDKASSYSHYITLYKSKPQINFNCDFYLDIANRLNGGVSCHIQRNDLPVFFKLFGNLEPGECKELEIEV
jgi:hypothetical protein